MEVATDLIKDGECLEQPTSPPLSPSLSPEQVDSKLDKVMESPLAFYQRVDADKKSRKYKRDTNYAIGERDHSIELADGKRAITYQVYYTF